MIAVLVLLLSLTALLIKKQEQTAEKFVFAVLGFLGGLGVSKAQQQRSV